MHFNSCGYVCVYIYIYLWKDVAIVKWQVVACFSPQFYLKSMNELAKDKSSLPIYISTGVIVQVMRELRSYTGTCAFILFSVVGCIFMTY